MAIAVRMSCSVMLLDAGITPFPYRFPPATFIAEPLVAEAGAVATMLAFLLLLAFGAFKALLNNGDDNDEEGGTCTFCCCCGG